MGPLIPGFLSLHDVLDELEISLRHVPVVDHILVLVVEVLD